VPDRTTIQTALPPLSTALGRGLLGRCPSCGRGRIFNGYLHVVTACGVCAAPLGLARADDAPPYFTILVVGHVVVGGMLMLEKAAHPAMWVQTAIWVPMTIILSLGLLRPIKGATVGLMLKLGMLKSDTDE
jgi:uncharacterized protein (DUF983 family)